MLMAVLLELRSKFRQLLLVELLLDEFVECQHSMWGRLEILHFSIGDGGHGATMSDTWKYLMDGGQVLWMSTCVSFMSVELEAKAIRF